MIHLIIKDGLGNQMFQYAYARCLQEHYIKNGINEKLMINPYFVQHRFFKDNDRRDMSIQHLRLCPETCILHSQEQKNSMFSFKIRILVSTNPFELFNWKIRKIKPVGRECFWKRARYGLYYTFYAYSYYGFPLSKCRNKYIFGFFQNEKAFFPIVDKIKKELLVKDAPSRVNQRMLSRIQSVNAVCLHIRRGDYLNEKWKSLQICTFEYYNNAINEILANVKNPVFFVFSNTHDDLMWIKHNYKFYDKTGTRPICLEFVDLNNPDYEELRLMYNCKYFIISNSTFSWWGAYLSASEDKKVYVPERWNLGCDNDYDIYPEGWIKISVK
ncbi:MAG: alpha-1,2-fucosyltransferase [Bacteroides sp.]|nr:alpha-1,2-fucosyltransferase [Bacteroides sp.]